MNPLLYRIVSEKADPNPGRLFGMRNAVGIPEIGSIELIDSERKAFVTLLQSVPEAAYNERKVQDLDEEGEQNDAQYSFEAGLRTAYRKKGESESA
ncbi:hypothetical protein [Saccharibacillus brassicae]|uniref:hypothetical protein n=1 Tax=Saccharibacillus brassicae TaxID=2583377 RepID=UPI0014781247|nr:hypothetical protein [Saccharibacillus brassicae]